MKKAVIASVLLAAVVVGVWFSGVPVSEFLHIHDQQLYFSREEILSLSFIRISEGMGVMNGLQLLMSFWDLILYYLLYTIGLSIRGAEMMVFFLSLFTCLFVSFLGFQRLSKLLKKGGAFSTLYTLALFYTFNTYTLIFWHTGNFSVTTLLTYSLLPLALSFVAQITQSGLAFRNLVVLSVILFLMSFQIPLFAVAALFMFCLFIFKFALDRGDFRSIPPTSVGGEERKEDSKGGYSFGRYWGFKAPSSETQFYFRESLRNIIGLMLLYFPLTLFIFGTIFYSFFNSSGMGINNMGEPFEVLLKGGLLNQLLMRFSWAIYNFRGSTNLFEFGNFFFNPLVISSYFVLYLFLLFFVYLRWRRDPLILASLCFFAFCLFFAKGGQPPFGALFNFLYDHFPPFKIFRTPDSKFGFGVVSSLSLILLWVSPHVKPKVFVVFVGLITLLQSYPLLNGSAIVKIREGESMDRAISVPSSYKKVARHITDEGGPILVLPPAFYATFKVGDGSRFVGRDLLSRMCSNLIYLNPTSEMSQDIFYALTTAVETGDIERLRALGIRGILLRGDVVGQALDPQVANWLDGEMEIVYQDNQFRLYSFGANALSQFYASRTEINEIAEIPEITFDKINPTRYEVKVRGAKEPYTLIFNDSFHKGWRIYKREITEIKKLADAEHLVANGYANSWYIEPEDVGGAEDYELIVEFWPQRLFYIGLFVSGLTLIGCGGYLIMIEMRKLRN